MSMLNQIPVATFLFAGDIFAAAAHSATAPFAAPLQAAVKADTPSDSSVTDALTEAAYTLLAFLLAGVAIQAMKQRTRRKTSAHTSNQKPAKLGLECAGPAQGRHAPVGQSKARAPLSTSQGAASLRAACSDAAATCERARKGVEKDAAPRAPPRGCNTEADILTEAVRAGRASELPQLMDAALARAKEKCADEAALASTASQNLLSALKACVARRYFGEALAAYNHCADRVGQGCFNRWSVLLYCAVETRDFGKCETFGDLLLKSGIPTSNDLVNIVRYHVQVRDVARFKTALGRLEAAGFRLDTIGRNRALAVCTTAKAFELAEVLAENETLGGALDVVGYNTLMKCFAQAGHPKRCFKFYAEMRRQGIVPSNMTFGILLDACVDAGEHARAREILQDIRLAGLQVNVVHYTTLMKGFANSGQLKEAMDVLDEMLRSPDTKPDLVTYSTLVKAFADHGKVMDAIRVLERMTKQGIVPDAIIFNIVLTGCCVNAMEAPEIHHVFQWLMRHGLTVSTTTLSILVKAFAKNCAWNAALDLLEKAPTRLNMWPETRLYTQLAQACARNANATKAIEAYVLMVRAAARQGVAVDDASNHRLLRLCSFGGASAAASKIFEAVKTAEGLLKSEAVDVLVAELG